LNDYDCNDPTENEGEWILNENIAFDYSLCLEDVTIMLGPCTRLYQSRK